MSSKLALIWAMTPNQVIGKDGGMPWDFPEDLKYFKRTTKGHAVIMGRKTYESIGRPLPKRRNIVVSRNNELKIEGCEVVGSIEKALVEAWKTDEMPFVIGGSALYEAALPHATHLYLTEIAQEYKGDVWFPEFDRTEWEVDSRSEGEGIAWIEMTRKLMF